MKFDLIILIVSAKTICFNISIGLQYERPLVEKSKVNLDLLSLSLAVVALDSTHKEMIMT